MKSYIKDCYSDKRSLLYDVKSWNYLNRPNVRKRKVNGYNIQLGYSGNHLLYEKKEITS